MNALAKRILEDEAQRSIFYSCLSDEDAQEMDFLVNYLKGQHLYVTDPRKVQTNGTIAVSVYPSIEYYDPPDEAAAKDLHIETDPARIRELSDKQHLFHGAMERFDFEPGLRNSAVRRFDDVLVVFRYLQPFYIH